MDSRGLVAEEWTFVCNLDQSNASSTTLNDEDMTVLGIKDDKENDENVTGTTIQDDKQSKAEVRIAELEALVQEQKQQLRQTGRSLHQEAVRRMRSQLNASSHIEDTLSGSVAETQNVREILYLRDHTLIIKNQTIQDLEGALDAYRAADLEKQAEIQSLRKTIQKCRAEEKELRAEVDAAVDESIEYEDEVHQQVARVFELEARRSEMEQSHENLYEKMDDLEEEFWEQWEELKSTQAKNRTLNDENKTLSDGISRRDNELKSEKARAEAHLERIKTMQRQTWTSQNLFTRVANEVRMVKRSFEEAKGERDLHRQNAEVLRKKLQDATEKLAVFYDVIPPFCESMEAEELDFWLNECCNLKW